jgi:hypothetical protein
MTKAALCRDLSRFGKENGRRTRPVRRLNLDDAAIEVFAKKPCKGATPTLATREDPTFPCMRLERPVSNREPGAPAEA